MGVTLERVQYKFASIIGELCSEPFVLSQFAVWLDLKLAEYKSKGCISLDCCGSLPEPDWLKGLKQAWHETKIAESAKGAGDPGDSFFSLSKDTNNIGSSGTTNTGYDQNLSTYNTKVESLSPRQTDQRHRHSVNRVDMTVDDSDNDVVLVDDEMPPEVSPVHRAATSLQTGDMYSPQYRERPGMHSQHVPSRASPQSVSPYSTARRLPSHPHSNQHNTGKRNSTARNIAAAVGHLRKWLNQAPRLDRRDILEIPTEELDIYLAEFFMTIKKASGENYTKRSFEVCRYSLERYLKQHRYPYSICKSPQFSKCQQSFHARKQSLPDSADWSYMYTPANRQSATTAATRNVPQSSQLDSNVVNSDTGTLVTDHQETQDGNSETGNSSLQFTSVLTSESQTVHNNTGQNTIPNIGRSNDNMVPSNSHQQQHGAVLNCDINPTDIHRQEELMSSTHHNEQSIKHEML